MSEIPHVVILGSPQAGAVGREIRLDGTLVMGRDPRCDLVLSDDAASRRHAELRTTPGGILLTDLESANGLWIGERRVVGPELLGDGAQVRVGSTLIQIRIPAPRTATATHSPAAISGPLPAGTTVLPVDSLDIAFVTPKSQFLRVADEIAALETRGELIEARGNQPFLLDDPSTVWIVESGWLEIFTVALSGGAPHGPRTHFLTVRPGEAIFGMDLGSLGAGFLAVARLGTTLRKLSLLDLRTLAAFPATAGEVAGLVDTWILAVSRQLTRGIDGGDLPAATLGPGDSSEASPPGRVRSASDVIWLESDGADLFLLGLEPIDARHLTPVTPESWAEPAETTTLRAWDTVSRISRPEFWVGLQHFHEALCQIQLINKMLARVDELHRLRGRSEYALVAREAAVADLAGVMGTVPPKSPQRFDDDEPEDVFQAFELLGQLLEFDVRRHPELAQMSSFDERVAALARIAKVRTRIVMLRERWWTREHGPMLARRRDGGGPVVLIQKNPGAYELYEPRFGTRQKVDENVALDLEPAAVVVYRSFPEGNVGVRELIDLGRKDRRHDFWSVIGSAVVLGLLGAVPPFFIGRILDTVLPEAERLYLFQFAGGLLATAVTVAAYRLVQGIASLRLQSRMDQVLQAALWNRLLDLPAGFFRDYTSGDLASRAQGITAVRALLSQAGTGAFLGTLSSVFYLGLMFYYSGWLTGMAVLLTLFLVAVTLLANLAQIRSQRESMKLHGEITGLVLQLILGLSKIRIGAAEDHAFHVWAERFSRFRKLRFGIGQIQNWVAVFSSGFPIFSSLTVFLVLKNKVLTDPTADLTLGGFIAFSAAFGAFQGAIQALSGASLSLVQIIPIYERLRPILTTPAEVDEARAYPGRLNGHIEISNVHYRYNLESAWVIRGVSLTIEPGEFVALVGPSGSGKSTLIRLLLGFGTAERGSLYLDGQDLRSLDLREVRRQLGVVLQDGRLLPGDIFRNIVGFSSLTLDDAWTAAEMAGLADDIRAMPMGMHTLVAEWGAGLSGGQRQRLMIARAIVRRPRILLFDEATSALDNRSQTVVTESLAQLQSTRIVVAHRLSTIRDADRICYLENGAILEQGKFDDLMRKNGAFARLARRQRV